MKKTFFQSGRKRLRQKTQERLSEYNKPSTAFFVFISIASSISALGLLMNNTSVIIGAMVIAPLITPVFALSLSIIAFEKKIMRSAALAILLGTLWGIALSMLTGLFFLLVDGSIPMHTPEILSRSEPNLLYFLVALLSGVGGAYAYARPTTSASIAGIAISVALVPPLSVVGLSIAAQDITLAQKSFLLFFFNLAGIIFGSILLFVAIGFAKQKK